MIKYETLLSSKDDTCLRKFSIFIMFMRKLESSIVPNCHAFNTIHLSSSKSNRKAMNRNWSNQKSNPTLKTKAGNK